MNKARNFIHHDYPVLKQINSKSGRFYTIEGSSNESAFKYPSVTSVVGILNKQAILEWRRRVGEEEANRVSARASGRGTRIHSLCENYLKGEDYDLGLMDKEVFSSMIPELDKIDNIHALEQRLFSHRLRVAGTVDAIANYNGTLSVIDFKTSKRVKSRDEISSYFLQTAAYSYMFYEMTGLLASQLVIIMGVDGEKESLVFIEKSKDWLDQFIDVRQTYRELYEKV